MTECLNLTIHRNGAQEEQCQVDAEFISVTVFLQTDQTEPWCGFRGGLQTLNLFLYMNKVSQKFQMLRILDKYINTLLFELI